MAEITLRKYHGLGNDYLIYDPNRNACELQERQVEALCRRNLGVGADGILYGPFFDGDKMRVRIFNPDGSEAEKSGNGIRIFSKYLKDMAIKGFFVKPVQSLDYQACCQNIWPSKLKRYTR